LARSLSCEVLAQPISGASDEEIPVLSDDYGTLYVTIGIA